MRLRHTRIGALLLFALAAFPLSAAEVAKADLSILGLGLEVDRNPVTTAVDVPSYVQTIFGGKTGDDAPPAPGLSVLGELTGPGINTPITIATTPGRPFALPPLHEKGEYAVQNIRLAGSSGEFLQQAVPSFAIVNVIDAFNTTVRVRQLSAQELRERGIVIDSRNYEVYEYTFVFGVDQSQIEIPYPVIIDKRTHQVTPVVRENPYAIPPVPQNQRPPRFTPPAVEAFDLSPDTSPDGPPPPDDLGTSVRPSIPAALVVPTGFGVLHQFFAVILQVDNGAPEGSNIRLDSVNATINAPAQLRIAKVLPAVSIGQPVPIKDEKTGATFLVAGGRGNAEWSLEALKAGTHTVNIEVNATYQKPGQADFPLRGNVQTSLVVSDPRFQINFSHPDTVRKDERYTAYAFVTNLSPNQQTVSLDLSYIPLCSSGAAADNICRDEGTPATKELTIPAGGMEPVPYKLNSKITGKVFAAAGVANDEGVVATVKLTMGVSASGIPLSPATLVMPYYARFLPSEFVDANMQLLGLGYSLATAPLNKQTAAFPRVIKTDVFTRAQQIARAGQRVFIARKNRDASDPLENREPFFHLALDLLGNIERTDQRNTAPELREWDDLRRAEESGRRAGAAMARQLETQAFSNGETPRQFAGQFAAATSHRNAFLFAYAHGAPVAGVARPYALKVKALTSGLELAEVAETCRSPHQPSSSTPLCVRSFPYSELTQFNAGGDHGELALVGRWREEDIRITVIPAATTFTLHLIYPDAGDAGLLRTDIDVTNAVAGRAVDVVVRRGEKTLIVSNATATPLVNAVPQSDLRVVGAAQDLHLDEHGHIVSMLFNRPIKVTDAATLRDRFALTMSVPKASYTVTRKNNPSDPNALLQIPGAALQDDARIINVSFDKTLSRNAEYKLAVEKIQDLTVANAPLFAKSDVVPRIDNDRPGAILTGRVVRGDNSVIPNVVVNVLSNFTTQLDPTGADGRFLFEFIPRDVDSGIFGNYKLSATAEGKGASLEGAVRLPGEVHTVNLQFLGRGIAKGQVRYNDREVIPYVEVTIGSTMFDQARRGRTDANGFYEIGDLPVGPLTFSVNDKDGRPTYAANQIRVAGEVVTQDLVIIKREAPGFGNIRVIVRRSDSNAVVSGALVGVWAQGYALRDGYTSTDGSLTFSDVPAGIVSVLAADFGISRNGAGVEVELRKDQTLEQTLVLSIPQPNVKYATLTGVVKRDDPAAPGDTTKDQIAPGAIVTIDRLPSVTADENGRYTFNDLTLDVRDRRFTVFDPATGRRGYFTVPTLVEGSNEFNPRLQSTQPAGIATMRVRLYGPQGEPVTGYRVIWPGYPATSFESKGNGVYELGNMRVPQQIDVVAVPPAAAGHSVYGQQLASGSVRVDFHGQVGVTDLRLPGSGTIVVRVEVEQSCATPPCGFAPAIGPVALTYSAWDEAEQHPRGITIEGQPDPNTGLVTFTRIPARQNVSVATVRNPLGYAATTAYLSYDGDVRNVTLQLKTIGDVSGRVYAHDGVTPLSGATVRIYNGRATYPPVITNPDGTFRFAGFPAGTSFNVVADLDRDGVYRTGIVGGTSPAGGGPVSNLIIVMRQQSAVEGQIVDNNTGAKVPLARYWLRELAWPYRSIGTPQDPLFADINGRFVVSNVFTGEFRITAVSPDNQEIRGDYQGVLRDEGDASQRSIQVRIGGGGTGAVSVTVVDPLLGFSRVANAEVALLRGGSRFDFTTTNDSGVAFFDSVPAGSYTIVAYSKAAGRAGHAVSFAVNNGQTTPITVQLEFRGYVSGTLTDPESEPVAGAPVKGMPVNMQATGISAADSTDENGFFEFNGVPEGYFYLSAFEIGTHRRAVGPTNLYIDRLAPERTGIKLELERTATLTLKVFLPNDNGGEGELAPLVEVTVWQGDLIHGPVPYYRGQQGNTLVFRKMLASWDYGVEVRELGGEQRVVRTGGNFGGALTKEQHVTLPTSGTVEVRVVDAAGLAVQDAKVTINSSGLGQRTMYTPASGVVTLPGVPFGWVSASASKGSVSASGGGSLQSRSQTLVIPLNLGSNATVAGGVDAEIGDGSPSAGTRVLLNVTTRLSGAIRLETITDSAGNYRFTGIPVGGTTLTLTFYGPDDTTIGATRVVPVADGTTGVITIPRVRIDATPPRVLSIDPPANATSVSPGTAIRIVFSEQIASGYLNSGWFQLLATDDGSSVNCTIEPSVRPDGTFIVRMIAPPPPAGQKFPLKSNVIYRLSIPQGIRDTTGNPMTTPIGSSFTTVNYTEPAIVRIEPAEASPIPASTTFRIKFNKSIAANSFDAGTGGVCMLERLDQYKGTAVQTIPISKFLDPADASTLVVAPQGVAIAESSFYRLTVGGARDTQTPPNVQKDPPRVFEFFSYDTKKPVAKITSSDETLISALLYTATVKVTDEGTTSESTDIAYVDWLDANGSAIARSRTKPFSYSFAAPATTAATTFTLKAVATDLSGNSSPEPDVYTWNVAPNEAPREIVVTSTPATAYPTQAVQTRVSFKDEGVSVNVALELRGTYVDGSPMTKVLGSANVTRASSSVAFSDAVFNYTLPEDLKDGTATIVAKVTDSVNKSGTGEAPLTILPDTTAPQLVSFLPISENRYKFNTSTGSYTIEVKAKDAETGISRAVITVGGVEQTGVTSTYDGATGVTTWRKVVTVPPRNADTRIAITATVYDKRNNVAADTHEVIYERVDDATLPAAVWITPLDGAALPSNIDGWQATLRVRATDDVKVTSVRFESSALAAPLTAALKAGTSDVYEAKASFNFPADKSPFIVKAIVTDADPSHDVELAITVDPVAVDNVISADINITSITASQYANRSVAVRSARLWVSVPLTVRDLILLDGAGLGSANETPVDLTITDRLFIDADSRADVNGRGYLGGWRSRDDGGFTNSTNSGRTVGGSTTGGATLAAGSHAGFGGSYYGSTNAAYGSITSPIELGSGGGAENSNNKGGNGGGAIALRGGGGLARFVLAGPVWANGDTWWSAGSGGSILIDARALITGPNARITANGGDSWGSPEVDMGGGGGRVSIRVRDRLDIDATKPVIQARGGRNGNNAEEGATFVDGGAGTIWLARPGSTSGELIVSSFDEAHAATTHRTAATPLAGALTFDKITIGPRALVRFDVAGVTPSSVDPTALVLTPADVPSIAITSTTPAASGTTAQNTSITARYNAASTAGLRIVRTILSVQPNDVVAFPRWVSTVTDNSVTIPVPSTATPGSATLKIQVTDRAGRTTESAPVSFTIVNNAAPVIDTFAVTPAAETYANRTLSVTATASDDIAVQSMTLTSSIGSVSSAAATKPTPTTMSRSFTVSIPASAPSNSDVVLTLSVVDDVPGRVPTTATKTIRILKDEIAPVVAITKPTASQEILEGTGATFDVEANVSEAEVAVKSVTATFDGATQPMTLVSGTLYRANFSVPSVDGSELIPKNVNVTASDYDNNITSRDVGIYIKPLIDPNAPALSWICASPGAMYPAGYEFRMQLLAVPSSGSNGVSSVVATIDGAAQAINATSLGSNKYEIPYTIPAGASDGTVLNVRVVVRSVGGNESMLLGNVTVVAGQIDVSTQSNVSPLDPGYQNRHVVVRSGGVLILNGEQRLKNVVVLDGGKIIQKHPDNGNASLVTVDRLFVACGATIDVTGQGFAPRTTYPGERASAANGAGSHIGLAGWRADAGTTYGSIYRPREAGAGEYYNASGGGVVRIAASRVVLDGTIYAEGQFNGNCNQGGGAGGSVWIRADSIRGTGRIEADGGGAGGCSSTNGGGGAIAIETTDPGSILPALQAKSGDSFNPYGGAGSLYTRGPSSTYGDVVFDNTGRPMESPARLPALGTHVVDSIPSAGTLVLKAPASVQPYFAGHYVRVQAPDGSVRGIWRIASLPTSTQLVLEGSEALFDVRAGDTIRGAYRFDSITLKNAWVETSDLVLLGRPAVIDASSRFYPGNDAPPVVTPSLVTFSKGVYGTVLSGAADAVADPDKPIDVWGRNANRPITSDDWIANGVTFGTAGGFSIRKITNGQVGSSAYTKRASNTAAFISCRASQTNNHMDCALLGGSRVYTFGIFADGTWQVWLHNSPTSITGTYTTNTIFRVELADGVVRFFKDGVQVHQVSADGTMISPYVGIHYDGGEMSSVVFSVDNNVPARLNAASDGSFTLGIDGAPGDPISLTAKDAHYYPLSSDAALGAIPDDFGVASLTFPQVTGGRMATGTVTLRSAAGVNGAVIRLISGNPALATVPASVAIPAGQTSATFTFATAPVVSTTNVTITATWGGAGPGSVLTLVKDSIAPTVTVTAPAPNSTYTEGQAAKITVTATATDDDSGVKRVFATLDGNSYELTKSGSVYTAQIPVPFVDGSQPVTRELVVSAEDNTGNTGSAPAVPLTINAVVDSNPPSIALSCGGSGAMVPVGYAAKFRVIAKAPNPANVLHKVELTVTDANNASTVYPAVSIGNDAFEATVVIPDVANGSVLNMRFLATTASATTAFVDGSFVVVKGAMEIRSSTTIGSSVTTYEGKDVVVWEGVTVTISGAHAFGRFVVLPGAIVNHAPASSSASTERVDIAAASLYIACGGAIDTTGGGFAGGLTYPGASATVDNTGASHIGRGNNTSSATATYGSVYRPLEHGAGDSAGARGGGVVKIVATNTVTVDGAIRANGAPYAANWTTAAGGAGGSVWIRTARIAGIGTIEADGGYGCGYSSAGGAVAIEYTDATSVRPFVFARGGLSQNGSCYNEPPRFSAPGSVYINGPGSTYGELSIDYAGRGTGLTHLQGIGTGLALTGSNGPTLITDRASDVPQYFIGHWVRITAPNGSVKGVWRIQSIAQKTLTLEANGASAPNVAAGDSWRGIYLFDKFTANTIAFDSIDPVEAASWSLSGENYFAQITGTNLVVNSGASLNAYTALPLAIDVTNEVKVAAGGTIDATGRGYAGGATYPGARVATGNEGGTHMGRGGKVASAGATYGSVAHPEEFGAGDNGTTRGGGSIRLSSGSLVVDGAIRASGASFTGSWTNGAGGAGGSIWIRTGALSGTGSIDADGGRGCGAASGGGAVAVEYSSGTTLPQIYSRGGTNRNGPCGDEAWNPGAPGTIFTKTAQSVYGSLTIDRGNGGDGLITELPSLGNGVAQSGSGGATLVTDLASNIPAYWSGHFVEIRTATGDVKGVWRIAAISGRSVTLAPNGGESIAVAAGDAWRGVYRFDLLKLRNASVQSNDAIRYTALDKDAASTVIANDAAPYFVSSKLSQIVIESTVDRDYVSAPAGTVASDPDSPIRIYAKNVHSGVEVNGNANADGSFRVQVSGVAGDTFTVRAVDSHLLPLSSPPFPVSGALARRDTLASLTFGSGTVTGGTSVVATLTLAAPARSGGTLVALTSSNSAAVVPATVTVPAGAWSTQFTITTTPPASHVAAVITASTLNAVSSTLNVVPPSAVLTSLTFSSATVEGGAAVDATVTLGAAAPAGGAVITLLSNSPNVRVQANVTVPAGATSATVAVATSRVGAMSNNNTITAIYGATKSASLTLTTCTTPMDVVARPASISLSSIWVDDTAPAGASGSATFDSTQVAMGTAALHFAGATGARTWSFSSATSMTVNAGDSLVLYALVNPCNPPRQILATWTDGSTQFRASWGEGRMTPANARTLLGSLLSSDQWTRLEIPVKTLGITTATNLNGLTLAVDGGEAWFDAIGRTSCMLTTVPRAAYLPNEVVWFDDALPAGAVVGNAFNWSGVQATSGTLADLVADASGEHQHYFTGASDGLTLNMEDVIVVYVLLDPCNPPRELMVQFNDGANWNRRAYWGENITSAGNAGTTERRRMGPLPEPGKWTRLEIPVSSMQMSGMTLRGVSFLLQDGQAWFDRVGKVARVNLAAGKTVTMSSWLGAGDVRYPAPPDPCPYNCPSALVDGDTYTFPHTGNQPREWVQVDLGAVQPVEWIDLWNAGANNCCYDRLSNFWILVSDEPFSSTDLTASIAQAGVSSYYYSPQALRPSSFEVRRTGRYIRIQLEGTNFLHPGELQVWAPLTAAKQNLSAGRKVSQSTTFDSRRPELAANANTNGVFGAEFSVNHTGGNPEEWWQADLGSIQPISSLDLWGRLDFEPHFPQNFYVFVSDDPFTTTTVAQTLADPKVSAYYYGAPATSRVIPIQINRNGRYVRVQYTSNSSFAINFAEVWVWSAATSIGSLAAPNPAPPANTAPLFPIELRSQIAVSSDANGDFVTAPAGAVTDPDTPIRVTATNTRTGQRSSAFAAANGSFIVRVSGAAGDTFTVRAEDSHPYSLISTPVSVNGALAQSSNLASMTIAPATVDGGSNAAGTVRLDYPAQNAITISLSSSSPYATVPATLSIPAGFSSAQFTIATSAVSSLQKATITASYRGTKSGSLTIAPASNVLASFTLSAPAIEGGTSLNGTLILGAAAPAGGAPVTLVSDNDLVSVPSSVIVPEGSTQVVFTVTTKRVGGTVRANITAIYGATKSATLDLTACSSMSTVTPPATIGLDAVWIDDGAPANSQVTGNGAVFDGARTASGSSSLYFAPSTTSRAWTANGGATLALAPSDTFVFYVLVNPCNPPRQLMMSWGDGTSIWRTTWGESLIDITLAQTRRGSMFAGGQWTRVEVPAKVLGITSAKTLNSISISMYGGEAWIDRIGRSSCTLAKQPAPQYGSNEVVWYDDTLPAGASQLSPTTTRSTFNWDTAQAASGIYAHLERSQSGLHEHAFENATAVLPLKIGDVLFTYVFLDPCDPPKEVMLGFQDQNGSWEHRAYWGESLIDYGAEGSAGRYRVGPLPETGKWVRLEVSVAALGLDDMAIKGNGFVLFDGQAWFDRTGRVSRVNLALNRPARQSQAIGQYAQPASYAFDGNLSTQSHTDNNVAQPWLDVDLGSVQPVQHIQIWNRNDCCTDRLRNMAIHVSEVPFTSTDWNATEAQPGVSTYYWTGVAPRTFIFEVNRPARYVRVQISATEYLHIPEMEIWAPTTPARVNVGGGSNAAQSSIWDGAHYGAFAVDGSWNSPGGSGASIFHTGNGATGLQWWMIDLGAVEAIDRLEIFNRPESQYQYNLQEFYVILTDTAFASPTSQDVNLFLNHPGAYVFYYGTPSFWSHTIPVNRTARWIRIHQRVTGRSLQLAEVRVWSQKKELVALSVPAETVSSKQTSFNFATAWRRPQAGAARAMR